jgi:hypothetical protein
LPCIIAFLLLSQNFSRADYDDAKKNHHTLKGAVVKPTLQNVFIQPLMHLAGGDASRMLSWTIVPLTVAVKQISSPLAIPNALPHPESAQSLMAGPGQGEACTNGAAALCLQAGAEWLT